MKHWLFLSVLMLCHSAHATSVWLNDWTSPELQEAIAQGTRTILIPTAGTEQNGPYLPLGKHHFVVHEAAQAIAKSLDKTLVAPILDYVPEGTISPPQGHMRFAGTLSLQEATYEAVLEDTARSFKQHGFTLICFLGDSGGNQSPQSRVAERLNKEWQTTEARVLQVGDYYHVSQAPVSQWLQAQGESTAAIGTHGGITDTSQLLAVNPKQVRPVEAVALAEDSGVIGDPRRANAAYGREILQRRIEAAVAQIRAAREAMNK